ncbi:MAG: type II toxin-antitoxin system prevent-host-death family antitoxin [Cellvibrionales bacterium]|nr:type II toxin-antitoxin system prevent-host-death family antitoxin [Cellvibrionales bacterium]
METVSISEFRANLLKYLEEVNAGHPISITSNGRLLATVTPPENTKVEAKKRLNSLAKTAKVGDVVTPTSDDWDALL